MSKTFPGSIAWLKTRSIRCGKNLRTGAGSAAQPDLRVEQGGTVDADPVRDADEADVAAVREGAAQIHRLVVAHADLLIHMSPLHSDYVDFPSAARRIKNHKRNTSARHAATHIYFD